MEIPSTPPYREKVTKEERTHTSRARGRGPERKPTLAEALSYVHGEGVLGEDPFVTQWYAFQSSEDHNWVTTKGTRIGHWRIYLLQLLTQPRLLAYWKRLIDFREGELRTDMTAQAFTPDWGLCRERCRHYRAEGGGLCEGCARGKIVPPQQRPRPVPPEECNHFSPVK